MYTKSGSWELAPSAVGASTSLELGEKVHVDDLSDELLCLVEESSGELHMRSQETLGTVGDASDHGAVEVDGLDRGCYIEVINVNLVVVLDSSGGVGLLELPHQGEEMQVLFSSSAFAEGCEELGLLLVERGESAPGLGRALRSGRHRCCEGSWWTWVEVWVATNG